MLCIECRAEVHENKLEKWWEIDFSINFFSQIKELIDSTYYQSLIWSLSNVKNNAEYTNHTAEIYNSYFVFDANTIEDSYYSFTIKSSKNIVDCSYSGNNEYLYESIDCYNMYSCFYSINSYSCKNSYFLTNCQNCSFCIWCSNLINKEYYIFNKKLLKKNIKI